MPRVPPLFDIDERGLERQVLVRKDTREVDQVVEEVQQVALLRAQAAAHDAAVLGRELDELLADDNGLDNQHTVMGGQVLDFVADRRQRAMLDLDQLAIAGHVDAVLSQLVLEVGMVVRVKRLELFVQ